MSDERDDPATRDDDELGGGGPTDLATGGELSETPGGSGVDMGGGTGSGGVGGGDPGGGGDATGDDTLDEREETDRPSTS